MVIKRKIIYISVCYSFDCFLIPNCFYSLNEKKTAITIIHTHYFYMDLYLQ